MEDYKSARFSLHITLIRNYMLELVIVGVLMVFWLTKSGTDVSFVLSRSRRRVDHIDFKYIFFRSAGKHLWDKKSID